jgi:hypothetical protein
VRSVRQLETGWQQLEIGRICEVFWIRTRLPVGLGRDPFQAGVCANVRRPITSGFDVWDVPVASPKTRPARRRSRMFRDACGQLLPCSPDRCGADAEQRRGTSQTDRAAVSREQIRRAQSSLDRLRLNRWMTATPWRVMRQGHWPALLEAPLPEPDGRCGHADPRRDVVRRQSGEHHQRDAAAADETLRTRLCVNPPLELGAIRVARYHWIAAHGR